MPASQGQIRPNAGVGICAKRGFLRPETTRSLSREPRDKRTQPFGSQPAPVSSPQLVRQVIVGDDVAVHQVCVESARQSSAPGLPCGISSFSASMVARMAASILSDQPVASLPIGVCLSVPIVERRCAHNNERFRPACSCWRAAQRPASPPLRARSSKVFTDVIRINAMPPLPRRALPAFSIASSTAPDE